MKNLIFFSSVCFLITLILSPINGSAQQQTPLTKVEIAGTFHHVLTSNPDFMKQGGAHIFPLDNGSLALIGIGKVFPENIDHEAIPQTRRKGEIRTRTAILELGEDIEVSTSRGIKEEFSQGISLSTFFQVTETRVQGAIQQMPVIGTWWSKNYGTFYVAVGKIMYTPDRQPPPGDILPMPAGRDDIVDLRAVEGEEPFLSLLRLSPLLCQNGGVRGFLIEDDSKALIAVGSASLKGGRTKAMKIARLKAIRSLIGLQEGIHLSSVEYLADQEGMRISLSLFLSVKEERVSGVVKALPVVAMWEDAEGEVLYVAIGEVFGDRD